jgi:hypothetical protein
MDAHDAVFNLADSAAMLPLDASSFVAFFDKAGLVNHPDAVRIEVMPPNVLLETITQALLIPAEQAEKLLQITGRLSAGVGNRLNAFAFQVAQLALDIQVQVPTGADAAETVVKLMKKTGQLRFDPQNCVGVHALAPFRTSCSEKNYRQAA